MDSYGSEKSNISIVGPWGGQGGTSWDDGVNTTIRQIVICHGPGICSIQIEYDNNGSSVWSGKHGGIGEITDRIKFDYPYEFLTTMNGYYGSIKYGDTIFILSLTLVTNKSQYGPFGIQQGTYFSFPTTADKIVGFHGSSGWYVDSIGVYLKPGKKPYVLPPPKVRFIRSNGADYSSDGETNLNKFVALPSTNSKGLTTTIGGSVSYGPWGGTGGTVFDDGVYTGIRQINLTRTSGIVSIKVIYDQYGKTIAGYKQGGTGAIKSDRIIFDYPFEVLTHITGYTGSVMYMGPNIVKSITFHTTKGFYGPYGDDIGIPFSSAVKEGRIVGFFGKKGWYIDCIGVHVIEGKVSIPQPSTDLITRPTMVISQLRTNKGSWAEEVAHGFLKESVPHGPGPWGGDGGKIWDDGVYCGIKQIYLTRGDYVNSIQILYDRTGQNVWSPRHGTEGSTTHIIKFEYPDEVVTCVSGYYARMVRNDGQKVIRSLTFQTSRGKHGPFGEEVGSHFSSTVTDGKVVGFHGRSSIYLDAIGVHMQHWLGDQKCPKSKVSRWLKQRSDY